MWTSTDAGLPVDSKTDRDDINTYLDVLYDKGIVLHWRLDWDMFVRGFDGRIRATDFKAAEQHPQPIPREERRYM